MKFSNEAFKELVAESDSYKLPPNSALLMEGKMEDYQVGKSFKITFPLKAEYENPAGGTLGGFFGVFFDLTYGPFSFLETKRPTTSLDLNISFIKPIRTEDNSLTVEVSLVSRGKTFLILEGKAYNEAGRLIATSTSRMMIL